MGKENPDYFLGIIVLTKPKPDVLQVVDGQQRLATTTIMLAILRDIFHKRKEPMMVRHIEETFLFAVDPQTVSVVSKIKLNLKDHEFFLNAILLNPDDPRREKKWKNQKTRWCGQTFDLPPPQRLCVLNLKPCWHHCRRTWS
jgi:uncharacterized protein with ParB-like and HNH nuclease domain